MKHRIKNEIKKQKKLEKSKNKVLKNIKRIKILEEKAEYDDLERLEELEQLEEEHLARINTQIYELKSKIKKHPKEKKQQPAKKRNKNEVVAVRERLILECGTVDMYDMLIYEERSLTLHHDPPFRQTRHTVFEESFLLTRENHDYVEYLQRQNHCAYERTMDQIRANKEKLIKIRKLESVPSGSSEEKQ